MASRSAWLLLLAWTALLVLDAPTYAQNLDSRAFAAASVSVRSYDGLLERPDLQEVVDLQQRRDGAALVVRLDDPDPAIRARAAFALGSVQDSAEVAALVDALADPEARVRADAAFALGQTADSTAAPALLAALDGEADRGVRTELLEALGKTGGAASLARVAGLEVDPGERFALAGALQRYASRGIHNPAAIDRLARMLGDEDPAVRARAAHALARMPDPAVWADRAAEARTFLDAIPILGPPAAVSSPSSLPEARLVAAIGRLDDPADDGRLIDRLRGAGDWRTRVNAARALADRVGEEDVDRALLGALRDPSTHVAVAAARAFSEVDSLTHETVREVARIGGLDRSRDWRITSALLPSLAKSGADAFVILYLMGLDSTGDIPEARANALEALGEGSTRAGFLVLEDEAAWEDPRVAAAGIEGLAARWRRGVLDDAATPERYYEAFAAAVRRGDVASVATAAPVLADSTFVAMGSVDLLADAWRALDPGAGLEARLAIRDALKGIGEAGRLPVAPEPPRVETIDWDALAALGPRPRLILETERGAAVTIEMDAGQAPLTVQTVARFAREGKYDGVPFHRVVPDFVVQGGDFARGDGWGGPGFAIRTEATRIPYGTGVVGMASAGKDTEGSQFFITHSPQPRLGGRYTAFGVVVEGMDVVDRLVEGDRIERARVESSNGERNDSPMEVR